MIATLSPPVLTQSRTKVLLRRLLLLLVLILNLRTFAYYPGGRAVEELWIGICLLSFSVLYPMMKIRSGWTFSKLELYLLGLILILFFLPAFSAYRTFGQPLGYGLLARRGLAILTSWLLLICAWPRRWVRANDFEAALVYGTWLTFGIYAVLRLFVNPARFADASPGFVQGFGSADLLFSVPGHFMVFGVLYYALRGLRERRGKLYIYSLLLYSLAIGGSGRALTVAVLATLACFLIIWRPLLEILTTLAKFCAVAVLAAGLAWLVDRDLVTARLVHFGDAFRVFTEPGQGQDASVNARVYETDIAVPYIKEHPILGNGILSAQWGGTSNVLPAYFYADDIGIIGIIFSFGVFGLIVCVPQYFFTIVTSWRGPASERNALLDGVRGFILFSALLSLTTGFFVWNIEVSTFFVVLDVLISNDFRRKNVQGARRLVPQAVGTSSF